MKNEHRRFGHDHPATTINRFPTTLDLNNSKLVYLYLDIVEEPAIADLQSTLGIKRLVLFPVLKRLTANDLIERNGETVPSLPEVVHDRGTGFSRGFAEIRVR